MFIIYGKNECPMCMKIKMVLEMLGKEYDYRELDKDYTEEEFQQLFPDVRMLPQIMLEGKVIGDANQTLKYLKEHRII